MQLVVGRVGRGRGIRGELTVQVHTDDPDLRFAAGSVLATEPAARGPLTVAASRWHSGRLLVRFAGYADRSQAEELRGTLLFIDSAEVGPAADPEEFHDHELIGLDVLTDAGEPVGVVTDVLHHGQDLLVVQPQEGQPAGENGGGSIPLAAGPPPEGDRAARRGVIDPPPGPLPPAAPLAPGGRPPPAPPPALPPRPPPPRPPRPR